MLQGASLSVTDPPAVTPRRGRAGLVPLSELAAANRQRDALYLLSEELHRADTLPQIYEAAMDAIESALDCDRSSILLFDDAGIMRFVASRGLTAAYRDAVTGHSPWRIDQADAIPIAIPDVAEAALEDELKQTVLNEGIRATAFIPLVSEGALIGKFMAYFRDPYAFSRDDLAVSLAIARQLAFAIQRCRTDERLQQRDAELAAELSATRMLQGLSIEMAHEVDVEGLYARIVEAARTIMRSDFASMQQFFPHLGACGELKLIGHHGFCEADARLWAWVRADGASICAAAIERRERIVVGNLADATFMAHSPEQAQLLAAGIVSAQTTPLMSRRGELVGMISTHWKERHEPSERDLRLLDILARLAADLIERKTHDEELRRREERLRTLTNLLTDVPWQARSDGAFAELQPAWENYTGQTWDEHAGHGWFEAIHPDDRVAVQSSWSTACFHAHPYEMQARLWHARSGQYRRCVIRATPIRNEDGSLREWVGACTDLDKDVSASRSGAVGRS
jgi:PAS domain S-box-containing protein